MPTPKTAPPKPTTKPDTAPTKPDTAPAKDKPFKPAWPKTRPVPQPKGEFIEVKDE